MPERMNFSVLSVCSVAVFCAPALAQHPAAWTRIIGDPATNPLPGYQVIDDGPWQGAPVGGLGAGTIGRTYRGDYARWHLDVGQHYYRSNPADQFSVRIREEGGGITARVLAVYRPEDKTLAWWNWDTTVRPDNRYFALFPKSWFQYKDLPVELTQLQFSPFIPHNYKESSYPVAVYRWQAVNRSAKRQTVSLMFTWENKLGWWRNTSSVTNPSEDDHPYIAAWGASEGNTNQFRQEKIAAGVMKGIVQSRGVQDAAEEWEGQFALAALETAGATVSYHTRFDPTGDGGAVWTPFSIRGGLSNQNDAAPAATGERVASALAVTFTLEPGASREIPFVLAWDLPVMEFGKGVKWYKRYTKFFGRTGRNAWAIAREGVLNHAAWEKQIDDWQRPILAGSRTPAWYKSALFNELYALVDSGTAWEDGKFGAVGGTDYPPLGRFGYLESFDYIFYSTLDVNAYASWAAALLFPELDKQEARLFADAVDFEDLREHEIGWTQQKRPRKLRGAVPMDLSVPYESPWLVTNQYTWQDANRLKDEGPNLALKVWRDFVWTGRQDLAFLKQTWPRLKQAFAYYRKMDTDGDGLLDSEGVPDQTYDSWIMTGPSAYVGALLAASLEAMAAIAGALGDQPAAAEYRAWLRQAQASYEAKLWNGAYYDFDLGSKDRKAVMADQLFGQFYAQLSGLPDVVPREHRDSVLRTVFRLNVMSYNGGRMGAVNGMFPDGAVVRVDERSNAQEVWTGVSYALAAFLLHSGRREEAWKTAEGVYRTAWETGGMWFRTPEGWTDQRGRWEFRASMYMRPLAVWAIQAALTGPPPSHKMQLP
jgi:non-lysosomal glucosylceramidase